VATKAIGEQRRMTLANKDECHWRTKTNDIGEQRRMTLANKDE
jgi:hypothetical protein